MKKITNLTLIAAAMASIAVLAGCQEDKLVPNPNGGSDTYIKPDNPGKVYAPVPPPAIPDPPELTPAERFVKWCHMGTTQVLNSGNRYIFARGADNRLHRACGDALGITPVSMGIGEYKVVPANDGGITECVRISATTWAAVDNSRQGSNPSGMMDDLTKAKGDARMLGYTLEFGTKDTHGICDGNTPQNVTASVTAVVQYVVPAPQPVYAPPPAPTTGHTRIGHARNDEPSDYDKDTRALADAALSSARAAHERINPLAATVSAHTATLVDHGAQIADVRQRLTPAQLRLALREDVHGTVH